MAQHDRFGTGPLADKTRRILQQGQVIIKRIATEGLTGPRGSIPPIQPQTPPIGQINAVQAQQTVQPQTIQPQTIQPQIAQPQVSPLEQRTQDLRGQIESIQNTLVSGISSTQKEQDIQRQLDNLLASRELGIEAQRQRVIPTPFITGATAAIQRQTAIQTIPLEQQLGRLQAQRQGALEVATTRLGFAETRLEGVRADIRSEREVKLEQARIEREAGLRKDTIQAVIDNPQLFNELTPTQQTTLIPLLQRQGFDFSQIREEERNTFEQRIVGGDLVEVELDPQGRVVSQRLVREGGDKDIDDFNIADQFITDNPDASRAELKVGLLENTDLTSTEINAKLDAAGIIKEKQQFTKETLNAIATGLVNAFKGGFLGFFADEEEGKRKAIEVLKTGTIKIDDKNVNLSRRQIDELVELVNNL